MASVDTYSSHRYICLDNVALVSKEFYVEDDNAEEELRDWFENKCRFPKE